MTDPHFGRSEPEAIAALTTALAEIRPALVIVGGDLTQRARRHQFRAARAFLDALEVPWLAIPGNHDVPLYDLFRRVFSPLGRYHRFVSAESAPMFVGPGVRVLGLDSTRRKVTGRLTGQRIAAIARLEGGEPGALRVLVTHHPLVRRPLEGAPAALAAAERAGVDVVLAGHHHQTHITSGPILAIEGPSPSHCLEAVKGFFVVRATGTEVATELWSFDGKAFAPSQARTFVRRDRGLKQR
ncbi:MAG: metallophosphoesterase [Solirubrobacteraceae bacterium]